MKVFLSHSSHDKPIVELVHMKLQANNAWLDAVDIENGDNIFVKINDGLKTTTHFVLFWSYKASQSRWVEAELSAAFVKAMSDRCKIMIFTLDDTELPLLLQPLKYSSIDSSDINIASLKICESIFKAESIVQIKNQFVNRSEELGNIELARDQQHSFIIMSGILGIGKHSLAKRAIEWLYTQRSYISIDFNVTTALPELAINLAKELKLQVPKEFSDNSQAKYEVQKQLEIASSRNVAVIFCDVKRWLLDSGKMNDNLSFLFTLVIDSKLFVGNPIFVTSSRFIDLPKNEYFVKNVAQFKINGMKDDHVSTIIKNSLFQSFSEFDEFKNRKIATLMHGYPLGARLVANLVSNFGYDYYLNQPQYINQINIDIAKDLVSHIKISEGCSIYLQILALCQSSLQINELNEIFPEIGLSNMISHVNEAFFSGLTTYEDGIYKLENIVKDYYYDLAFNNPSHKNFIHRIANYTKSKAIEFGTDDVLNYARFLRTSVNLLFLDNRFSEAIELRSDMWSTMADSMWGLYNHREYLSALSIANELVSSEEYSSEGLYMQALCLMRNDDFVAAQKILFDLILKHGNDSRYLCAIGRIFKLQENYEMAISYFDRSIKNNERYLSAYREISECYLLLDDLETAEAYINKARAISSSNPYIAFIMSKILCKQKRYVDALAILQNPSLIFEEPAQIEFRKGIIYENIGNLIEARACFTKAIELDSNQIDAELGLLNQDINAGIECDAKFQELRRRVKGKRFAILSNIEARYIGFIKHQVQQALEILESTQTKYIDRRWYIVKVQLLEKLSATHADKSRRILASDVQRDIVSLKLEYEKKFKESFPTDTRLTTDTD